MLWVWRVLGWFCSRAASLRAAQGHAGGERRSAEHACGRDSCRSPARTRGSVECEAPRVVQAAWASQEQAGGLALLRWSLLQRGTLRAMLRRVEWRGRTGSAADPCARHCGPSAARRHGHVGPADHRGHGARLHRLACRRRADALDDILSFTASAGKDVAISFRAKTGNVVVNGFELDVPDASKQASDPSPANHDEHVDADSGALELSWKAANKKRRTVQPRSLEPQPPSKRTTAALHRSS